MIPYLIILFLAWKPIYFVAMYAYKRDYSYLTSIQHWLLAVFIPEK
jgi:hypothetical protein